MQLIGDIVHIQTWDCYRGEIKTNEDVLKDINEEQLNPATGPIFISGIGSSLYNVK